MRIRALCLSLGIGTIIISASQLATPDSVFAEFQESSQQASIDEEFQRLLNDVQRKVDTLFAQQPGPGTSMVSGVTPQQIAAVRTAVNNILADEARMNQLNLPGLESPEARKQRLRELDHVLDDLIAKQQHMQEPGSSGQPADLEIDSAEILSLFEDLLPQQAKDALAKTNRARSSQDAGKEGSWREKLAAWTDSAKDSAARGLAKLKGQPPPSSTGRRAKDSERLPRSPLSVQGIVWTDNHATALIGGEPYAEGEQIEGYTVKRIERTQVVLGKDGQEFLLRVGN